MDDSPRHDFEGKNPDTKGHIFDFIDIKGHQQAKLIREIAIRIVIIFPGGGDCQGALGRLWDAWSVLCIDLVGVLVL